MYLEHLEKSTPPLAPHLAAVAALAEAVSLHPLSTISETLTLLSALSERLTERLAIPERVLCGTDLLQRQLSSAFAKTLAETEPEGPLTASKGRPDASGGDFGATKAAIVGAGKRFVAEGLKARSRAGNYGRRFILNGATIFVVGYSSLVDDFIKQALQSDADFQIVFVATSEGSKEEAAGRKPLLDAVEDAAVPSASISLEALALHLSRTTRISRHPTKLDAPNFCPASALVLTGASAVFSDGSILASRGTHTAAATAKAVGRPFWVVSETNTILSWFPSRKRTAGKSHRYALQSATGNEVAERTPIHDDDLDATPASLITGIITEHGPQNTSAIGEEAIRTWF